jgi:hypothetical protein
VIDFIGYLAYVFCLVGWLVLDKRFKMGLFLNLIGAVLTIIYGVLIMAMPVIVFNVVWGLVALKHLIFNGREVK